MAWPCISRACCLARFWSQLDQADIAVPLIFTSYTDACEPRGSSAAPAVESQPSAQEVAPRKSGAPVQASVMRQDFKAWKVRREPSCKPKHEYHEPDVPLDTETQYQKDFKPWPLPRRDHPWIPKPSRAEPDGGVEKGQIADRVQEKEILSQRKVPDGAGIDKGGRAAADALNRQIKEEVTDGSSYRNEFKAYADVKPARPIRAKSQYHPPDEKTNLETSYSATYRGEQAKLQPAENKALERRRVRTLYSEPHAEASRVDRSSLPRSKPKKTPASGSSHGKPAKKLKEKQASARGSKKSSENQRPSGKEKSKEMNNKLAEAKEVMLKQQHYIQLCQPIRDIGWVQTLKQHLWRCAMPDPRDSECAGGRVSDFYSSGTSGAEQEPQEARSRAVVRFAPDVKY